MTREEIQLKRMTVGLPNAGGNGHNMHRLVKAFEFFEWMRNQPGLPTWQKISDALRLSRASAFRYRSAYAAYQQRFGTPLSTN